MGAAPASAVPWDLSLPQGRAGSRCAIRGQHCRGVAAHGMGRKPLANHMALSKNNTWVVPQAFRRPCAEGRGGSGLHQVPPARVMHPAQSSSSYPTLEVMPQSRARGRLEQRMDAFKAELLSNHQCHCPQAVKAGGKAGAMESLGGGRERSGRCCDGRGGHLLS